MKKYRKFVTSSVGFTFLVVAYTGLIFKFLFKNRVLEDIHGWLGVLMVLAAIFHMIQNWGPLRSYLRERYVLALWIPISLVIGLCILGQKDKNSGVSPKQVVHQLSRGSITDVAKALGKDVNLVVNLMVADGLQVNSPLETIEVLARNNHRGTEVILGYLIK